MNKNDNKNSAVSKTENIAKTNQTEYKTASDASRESVAEAQRLSKLNELKLKEERRIAKIKLKQDKKLEADLKRRKRMAEREEKLRLAKEKKSQKQADRANNGVKKPAINGFITAIICLSLSTLITGGLLLYVTFSPADDYLNYQSTDERNFYELVGNVNGVNDNLSKALVSADAVYLQSALGEVRLQSSMATENLTALSIRDEEKFYTVKFLNQVSDYSKYLTSKLNSGESLTSEDYKTLTTMYDINKNLKNELLSLSSSIDENFNFSTVYEDKKDNLLIAKFIDLEKNASTYPPMVYDGDLSDVDSVGYSLELENQKEISKLTAQEVFENIFKSYGVKNVELTGETNNKAIKTYNFDADLSDGTVISATISQKGGKLINFNNFRPAEEVKYSQVDTLKIALNFLDSVGLKGLKVISSTQSESNDTYVFAYYENDIIHYADAVNLNVCKERGIVCSMEAKPYYLNHKQRVVGSPKITKSEAQNLVFKKLSVTEVKLALIPVGISNEVLAYEVVGDYNGETYYVYINAENGKEVLITKVL